MEDEKIEVNAEIIREIFKMANIPTPSEITDESLLGASGPGKENKKGTAWPQGRYWVFSWRKDPWKKKKESYLVTEGRDRYIFGLFFKESE